MAEFEQKERSPFQGSALNRRINLSSEIIWQAAAGIDKREEVAGIQDFWFDLYHRIEDLGSEWGVRVLEVLQTRIEKGEGFSYIDASAAVARAKELKSREERKR